MWNFNLIQNGDVVLVKNDQTFGKVELVERSNKANCMKIYLKTADNDIDVKILDLEKFDWRANSFSARLQNSLDSRTKFLSTWRELSSSHDSDNGAEKKVSKVVGKDEKNTDKTGCKITEEKTKGKSADTTSKSTEKEVKTVVEKDENNKEEKDCKTPEVKIKDKSADTTSKSAEEEVKKVVRKDEKNKDKKGCKTPEEKIKDKSAEEEVLKVKENEKDGKNKSECFDKIIQKKFKGYHKVPVRHLVQPSFDKLVRQPDNHHIDVLEREFKLKPSNYFTMMVVNIPDVDELPENFENCKLETIGGNHSRIALQRLLQDKEVDHQYYNERVCKVYCNLTPEEAKKIGIDHNYVHKLGMELKYFGRIECFRATLFQNAGFVEKDDPQKKPTPQKGGVLEKWKHELQNITGVDNRKSLNNRFRFDISVAQMPTSSWNNLRKLIYDFEQDKKKAITGRQLRCLDGVDRELVFTYLKESKDFKNFQKLCESSKQKKKKSPEKDVDKMKTGDQDDLNNNLDEEEEEKESIQKGRPCDDDIKNLVQKLKKDLEEKRKENDRLKLEVSENKILLQKLEKDIEEKNRENDSLRSEVLENKKKIEKLYRENQKLNDELRKRQKQDTLSQVAMKNSKDIDLNPSPTKKLRTEVKDSGRNDSTPKATSNNKRNPVENTEEVKEKNLVINSHVEGFWKEDGQWYEAIVLEKRKTGYLVEFTLDKKKRVLKTEQIRLKI